MNRMHHSDPTVPSRDEDYNLIASVTDRDGVKRRLVCRIWLPRRVTDELVVLLSPNSTRRYLGEFVRSPISIGARTVDWSGTVIRLSIDRAWTPRARSRSLSGSRRDILIEAEPRDLLITKRYKVDGRAPKLVTAHTRYLLTDCPALAPADAFSLSYTGEVSVEHLHHVSFTLRDGTELRFENYYTHESTTDGRLSYGELVAVSERHVTRREFFDLGEGTVQQLDEFLALVGFGARYRSSCIGLIAGNDLGDDIEFYRRSRVRPENDPWDSDFALIDSAEFESFLEKAYGSYVATGPAELITQALHLVTPRPGRTVESSFTTLYAALETIVLWYRQRKNLELIVPDESEWDTLRSAIRDHLTHHPLLAGPDAERKRRRGLLRAKVDELRRVPFRAAFESLCSEYNVVIDDLWPMFSRAPEISLTEMRNRIVHGRGISGSQRGPLWGAEQHMRWTVERVLLAVLRWPIERSRLRPEFLARNLTAMIDLQKDLTEMRDEPIIDGISPNQD